jgi:hypothetical protein
MAPIITQEEPIPKRRSELCLLNGALACSISRWRPAMRWCRETVRMLLRV